MSVSYNKTGWSCNICNRKETWDIRCEHSKGINHGRVEERDGEWFRPQVQNDWNKLTYAPFLMFDTGTNVRVDPAVQIVPGQHFDVRWPDGSMTAETVEARPYRTSVSDMGHEYGVSTAKLVVCVPVRGVDVDIDIRELWLWGPK